MFPLIFCKNNPHLSPYLNHSEKGALIIDAALLIIASTAGILLLLANNGLPIGGLNTLGLKGIIVGAGLVTVSLIWGIVDLYLCRQSCKKESSLAGIALPDVPQIHETVDVSQFLSSSVEWKFKIKKLYLQDEDDPKVIDYINEKIQQHHLEKYFWIEQRATRFLLLCKGSERELESLFPLIGLIPGDHISVWQHGTTLNHKANGPRTITKGTNFKKIKEKYLKQGLLFITGRLLDDITFPRRSGGETLPEFFDALLPNHQGICVGGEYRHGYPKKMLIDNLPRLKERHNLDTLYLTQFCFDTAMQDYLNLYFESKIMPEALKAYLSYLDMECVLFGSEYNYTALVTKAIECGIRVVGIDTSMSFSLWHGHEFNEDVKEKERLIAVNSTAAAIIEKDQDTKAGRGKYIALMDSLSLTRNQGVPGVGQGLGAPTIMVGRCGASRDHKINTREGEGLNFETNLRLDSLQGPVTLYIEPMLSS